MRMVGEISRSDTIVTSKKEEDEIRATCFRLAWAWSWAWIWARSSLAIERIAAEVCRSLCTCLDIAKPQPLCNLSHHVWLDIPPLFTLYVRSIRLAYTLICTYNYIALAILSSSLFSPTFPEWRLRSHPDTRVQSVSIMHLKYPSLSSYPTVFVIDWLTHKTHFSSYQATVLLENPNAWERPFQAMPPVSEPPPPFSPPRCSCIMYEARKEGEGGRKSKILMRICRVVASIYEPGAKGEFSFFLFWL